jgi:hypothetical protein
MPSYPTADESRDRLHRAGWSLGEIAFGPLAAEVWQVDGQNGENRLLARGRTQSEAWWCACLQAREVGRRGARHDDLVLAVALACWCGESRCRTIA